MRIEDRLGINSRRQYSRILLISILSLLLIAACAPANPVTPPPDSAQTPTVEPVLNADNAQEPEPTAVAPAQNEDMSDTDAQAQADDAASDTERSEIANQLEQRFDSYAQAERYSGAVLVAQDGDILLSKGYGMADREAGVANGSDTRFRIGSLTKQFTAMVVLVLQEQGLLNIADPVCDYIDYCPTSWSSITIEQLLAHTAGVPDFTHFPDYESTKHIASSLNSTIDRFRERPLEFEPGTDWNYSNSGYVLLGQVIENATGQEYADVVQETIFDPLGMADSGYDSGSSGVAVGYKNLAGQLADKIDMSIPHAAGALYSTANDMLTWDHALSAGVLLSPELQEVMFTRHADIPQSGGMGYGFGWILGDINGRQVQTHNGGIDGFVANITRFPDDNAVIIVLSNNEQTNPQDAMMAAASALFASP